MKALIPNFANKRSLVPYFFTSPLVLLLLFITLIPVLYSIFLSLSYWPLEKLREAPEFIGFDNYFRMLYDQRLISSLKFTLFFTITSVPIEIILGLLVALILNTNFPGRQIVRSIFVLPLAVSMLVTGLIWRYIFNYDYGLLNFLLGIFHVAPIPWLIQSPWPQISLVIAEVWIQMPFCVLVLLAGLQSIPEDLYESAKLDGASGIKILRFITLPLLRPPILVVSLITITNAVRSFELAYSITGGGPMQSTETFSFLAYQVGFRYFDLPYAAAISWFILAINLIISLIFLKKMYIVEER
jgi:multiple sugar transport system permease protein